MKRLNIGIDVDDVLADFVSKHVELCHSMFGKPELQCKPVDWMFSNYGLTTEQLDKVWKEIAQTENFWRSLNVTKGASGEAMKKLYDHRRFFITSRMATQGHAVERQTGQWLEAKMGVFMPTVLVSSNKGPLAAALELDYFVDDRPKNCVEVYDAIPTCKVFIKDTTHNREFSHPAIQRVGSFDEFVQEVQKHGE